MPGIALAEESDPYQSTSADAVLKALDIVGAKASDRITISVPMIAENGASMPVAIDSMIAGTTEIITVISRNPKPLAASN